MLTIFTTPKPFAGEIGIHQYNAIRSFCKLTDDVLVMEGDAQLATALGARHIGGVRCNEIGLPYIPDLFRAARDFAKYNLLAYANADIVLMKDLLLAAARAATRFGKSFLMVGQKTNIDLDTLLTFGPFWGVELREYVSSHGVLHSVSGKDWFVFPSQLKLAYPPFVVGRPMWDNWTLDACLQLGVPVIDATKVVLAVHQNHGPKHHLSCPWSKYNDDLGKVPSNKGRISEATWEMTADAIRRRA